MILHTCPLFSTLLFHFVQTIVFKSNTLIEYLKNIPGELLSFLLIPQQTDNDNWYFLFICKFLSIKIDTKIFYNIPICFILTAT